MEKHLKLKIWMLQKGIKLIDLAAITGLNVSSLSAYINGYRKIPKAVQLKISAALNLPVEKIFDTADDNSAKEEK